MIDTNSQTDNSNECNATCDLYALNVHDVNIKFGFCL